MSNGGCVVSSAINKYIYVTVKRHSKLFEENYRLSYSITEHVDSLDDIKNEIARECLKLVHVDAPLYIATSADLPAQSGLGSSSSFAVGLLHALHVMRGEFVSAAQLAEEACCVEIECLKRPIGKQDQYAAAFGGLNRFNFTSEKGVAITPIVVTSQIKKILFEDALLFWTGMQRKSQDILEGQKNNIANRMQELSSLKILAEKFFKLLHDENLDAKKVGDLLGEGWLTKTKLSQNISNLIIDDSYQSAISSGAFGGKLLGAGGGGFLYFITPNQYREKIIASLNNLIAIPIKYEPQGSRILSILRN